ncbi:MAG TPA: class I SAM-dependent RNA methyltransferase [Saprospiraceae bacterium]|nr:class I SAM-dependent RNA methyltransferase [Saprospiraceae bacterium]
MEIVVTTFKGLEDVLANELINLGAQDVQPGVRAVSCYGDKELIYRANYELRTALRVLVPFHQFIARDIDTLYKKIRSYNFSGYLSPDQTFAIDVVLHSEYFTHSQFVMHKIKDGIVDRIRASHDVRPSIDVVNPDFRLNVRISGDQFTLSVDSSGESLHKRGYRTKTVSAPMSETLAAGLVYLSGWNRESLFIDPMAGSGTIAIEAAMMSANIPPQFCRKIFAFQKWRNFDQRLWNKVVQEAGLKIKSEIPPVFASDKSRIAIDNIKTNVERLPLKTGFIVSQFDFFNVKQENATIIMNPPYDERMKVSDVYRFYEEIGNHLKHKCPGSNAWIFSSNMEAMKYIGLKPSKKFILYNGPLECRYHGFQLFSGTFKHNKKEE